MEQLVRLRETNNPKLATALKAHVTDPAGAVLVHVRLDGSTKSTDVMAALKRAGFELQAVSQLDPNLFEGYLPLSSARAAASIPGVRQVLAVQRPHASAGAVQSQAVAVQKAAAVHARGIDGTGTRVGLLSDSFNFYGLLGLHPNAVDDVNTKDLPSGVVVLDDLTLAQGVAVGAADEGRAMGQLVHDLAPGAKLGFATAFKGEVSFANNILDLRNKFHADVIVDDVGYSDEPMYSDGLIAQAVSKVVADGAAYFSSAGNNSLEAYESSYDEISLAQAKHLVAAGKENLDLDTLAAQGVPVKSFHNFRNRDGSISISQKFTSVFGIDALTFQWDEPFDLGKVKTDYNLYVFDAAGHYLDPNDPSAPIFATQDDNTETDEPAELVLFFAPGEYQLVIGKVNDGDARRIKYIDINALGESARQNAPSIFGHPAAKGAIAVGAMFYDILNFPEDFSSPGPVTILFDTAGNRLRVPEIRRVPQITGVDGVDTTFFGFDLEGNGAPNFFGTSAAAPDVAGVAALVLQSFGGRAETSPDEIYDRLLHTATPIPLAVHRTLAASLAGPVVAAANGDYPGADHYWSVAVLPLTRQTVKQVTIDLTKPDMFFVNPANANFGFKINSTHGIAPSDVTATTSPDGSVLTLTFTSGKFGAGDFLTFSLLAVPNALPLVSQVDADRVQGGRLTITMTDGSTRSGTFFVDFKLPKNAFTGAGLVNADAATRRRW
ncbi:MAG TPA: S8 family serine peptidase [Vicinamibacterales bacterium]